MRGPRAAVQVGHWQLRHWQLGNLLGGSDTDELRGVFPHDFCSHFEAQITQIRGGGLFPKIHVLGSLGSLEFDGNNSPTSELKAIVRLDLRNVLSTAVPKWNSLE